MTIRTLRLQTTDVPSLVMGLRDSIHLLQTWRKSSCPLDAQELPLALARLELRLVYLLLHCCPSALDSSQILSLAQQSDALRQLLDVGPSRSLSRLLEPR